MRKKAVNKDFVRCSAFDLHYSLFLTNDYLHTAAGGFVQTVETACAKKQWMIK